MVKPSKRSAQAKRQRADRGSGFGSGFTDDPFDTLTDPDFVLTEGESDDETPHSGSAVFTLIENRVEDQGDEEAEEENEDAEDLETHIAHSAVGVD
ncbi:hypothetical protein C0991_010011, partial [Blastosporella zonata]